MTFSHILMQVKSLMNRIWIRETNEKRKSLERQIVALLKSELALMQKKKELYQQYKDLVDAATDAYQNQDMSVW